MSQPLLEIRNLCVGFHAGALAVENLNLEIPSESFTALTGESGSGKSVTALSVTRLIEPQHCQGEILFRQDPTMVNLLTLAPEELRRIRGAQIAYVFQDTGSSLNPVMRVGEQLCETLKAHRSVSSDEARRLALAMLDAVRLSQPERVLGSFPHELSGGMRQRVMIAMALLLNPRLLIADEATTALDPKTQEEILSLLMTLKKERRLTLLFITHDLVLAERFADQICILRKGRRVSLKDPYAKRLFAASRLNQKPKTFLEVEGC